MDPTLLLSQYHCNDQSRCVFPGAVAVSQSQVHSQKEELQELWDRHSQPVQGDFTPDTRRVFKQPWETRYSIAGFGS